MKKSVALLLLLSIIVAGCSTSNVSKVPTRTTTTKYIVETDCK